MEKISVIIPIYNVEKYIAECLESVINQTYSNLEIICIDDCGSDNSMKIVQEYADKDSRIKIIRHEENSGLAPARNTGLNNADGDYILFLDSDDYLMPDIIQKMYDKIKSTDLDFVNSSSKAFADNPNDKALVKKAEKAYLDYKGFDGYKVTLDNLEQTLLKLQCLAWGKMFKTKFLKENNININQTKLTPKALADLVELITKGTISNNIAKKILPQMLENGADPKAIVEKEGLSVISDEGAIKALVEKVVSNNPAQVQAYKNGKTNLMGFFVGQIMKETKGRANPQIINKLLSEELNK